MDTKKYPIVHGRGNATVIDLAKYKRGLKSAVKKPRKKKVPKFEIMVCNCGGTDFKFVMASDLEHLRNRIVCACCAQPVDDPAILSHVSAIAQGLL